MPRRKKLTSEEKGELTGKALAHALLNKDDDDFDYSQLSEQIKIKSYERKARIKANEQVATKAFYDIAQDIKSQHDDLSNYQLWLEWCEKELGYKSRMSESLLKIGKELPHYSAVDNLPTSYKGLLGIAEGLSKAKTEESKQEIIEAVQTATEEKGKPLTEKEIKAVVKPYQEQIENLEREKTEMKDKISNLSETVIDHSELIQKLNNEIEENKEELEQLELEREWVEEKEAQLDKEIKAQAQVRADTILEDERKQIEKQKKAIEAKEKELEKQTKELKTSLAEIEKAKNDFNQTDDWIETFEGLNQAWNENTQNLTAGYRKLLNIPDLESATQQQREKIDAMLRDFHDNSDAHGRVVANLHGAVRKIDNSVLKTIDVDKEVV